VSDGADVMWWKNVPEVGAGNRKSPFADGREIVKLSACD